MGDEEEPAGIYECAVCGNRGAPQDGLCVKCRAPALIPAPSDFDIQGAIEATEDAIASRLPLSSEEKLQGWEEDPGGSGLRRNRHTGEYDDSLFCSFSCTPIPSTTVGARSERPNLYVVRTESQEG